MFQTKKKKIQKYLSEKSPEQFTPFDELLDEYLSGKMKEIMVALGTKRIEITSIGFLIINVSAFKVYMMAIILIYK